MEENPTSKSWMLLFLSWVIALVSSLGVLFIGEIMGQEPCVLCWYQRTLMFPLAIILGVAAARNDYGVWLYALPLSILGSLVSLYHTLLLFKILPEPIKPCSATGPSCSGDEMFIFGIMPLPLLSLTAFILIATLILTINGRSKS